MSWLNSIYKESHVTAQVYVQTTWVCTIHTYKPTHNTKQILLKSKSGGEGSGARVIIFTKRVVFFPELINYRFCSKKNTCFNES